MGNALLIAQRPFPVSLYCAMPAAKTHERADAASKCPRFANAGQTAPFHLPSRPEREPGRHMCLPERVASPSLLAIAASL